MSLACITSMKLNLSVVNGCFTIHRFSSDAEFPMEILQEPFYSISRTEDELSIVCESSLILKTENYETGWSCIKVLGPLDFSLTGILADISKVLANKKISIFALSTFDTDYILVKKEQLKNAKQALQNAEYKFKN